MSETNVNETVEAVNRAVTIYGGISQDSMQGVIEELLDIQAFDAEYLMTYGKDAKLLPVVVDIVSCPGGDAWVCQCVIDILLSLKAPVITRCLGQAQSAGFLIFLTGDIRIAGKHSTLMFHQVSYDLGMNTFKIQKQELKEFGRMQRRMDELVTSRTCVTKEELEEWAGSEKYFDWDEAFNYGIITDDLDLDFMYFVDWLNLGEEENKNEE